MANTLDRVPGTWTLWVRTKEHPTTAYQATFVASSPDAREGHVTLTADGKSYSGKWQDDKDTLDEHVKFQIKGLLKPDHEVHFTGHMVGRAMGGFVPGWLGVLDIRAAWAGSKTSD